MYMKGNVIPVSIGTALAFQGLYGLGDYEGKPMRKNPHSVDNVVFRISVTKLVRNFVGAIEDKNVRRDILNPKIKLANSVYKEYGELFSEDCMTLVKEIESRSKNAIISFRTMSKEHSSTEKRVNEYLVDLYKEVNPHVKIRAKYIKDTVGITRFLEYVNVKLLLDTVNPMRTIHSVLMGGRPYILADTVMSLFGENYGRYLLIESHTGKIKDESEYYTKYYPLPKMSMDRLPFTVRLMLFFGDRAMISPAGIVYRREMMSIINKRVSPKTRDKRIDSLVSRHGSDLLKKLYLGK